MWDQVAETSAVPPSGEFPLSPQLYFPRSTHANISPVPAMVDPSPGKHELDRPSWVFSVDHTYLFASPSPPENALARPQTEEPLEDVVLVPPQLVALLVQTPACFPSAGGAPPRRT